jgi:hypothetical protein
VLADGVVAGRIMKADTAPVLALAMDLRFQLERQPAHGYSPTREAAMTAFAKNWRRE